MPRPLRAHRPLNTECGPRQVVIDDRFRCHKSLTPDEKADLESLIELIENGADVPARYCRPRSGENDQLLATFGVLHLHLGRSDSDTLLFLVQSRDRVILLETNTHRRFWNDCQPLIATHRLEPIPAVEVAYKKRPRTRPKK